MFVLERKILKTIRKYQMLSPGDKVLVAVSGGVDSVVLLRNLHVLSRDQKWELAVAHLDHQMRTGSDSDGEFVGNLADELGVPYFCEKINVPQLIKSEKRSPEEAARIARYDFLRRAARDFGAKRVALGHNLNDRAETFLLNLLRGSGLQGLAGMPPVRRERDLQYIRPLIECTRSEIEAEASVQNWSFRDDPTNKNPAYTRNRVRNELLPLMLEFNPHGLEAIARASEILNRVEGFLQPLVKQELDQIILSVTNDELLLDRKKLIGLDEFMLESVLREAIRAVKGDLNGVEVAHLQRAMHEISKKSSGSWVPVVGDLRLVIEAARIRITKSGERADETSFEYELKIGQTNPVDAIRWSFSLDLLQGSHMQKNGRLEAVFDFDKIKEPIVVRSRRPGDRFQPLGLQGEKKIQDLLVDAKVPRERRGEIPILCDSNGILWVVGLRVSERASVLPDSKRTLRIRALSHGQE